jgi:hypothetical protein
VPAPPPPPRRKSARLSAPISLAKNLAPRLDASADRRHGKAPLERRLCGRHGFDVDPCRGHSDHEFSRVAAIRKEEWPICRGRPLRREQPRVVLLPSSFSACAFKYCHNGGSRRPSSSDIDVAATTYRSATRLPSSAPLEFSRVSASVSKKRSGHVCREKSASARRPRVTPFTPELQRLRLGRCSVVIGVRNGPLPRAVPLGVVDAQAGPGTVSACAEPGTTASAVTGAAMSTAIRPRLAARIAPMIAVTAPKPGACGT